MKLAKGALEGAGFFFFGGGGGHFRIEIMYQALEVQEKPGLQVGMDN